MNRILAPVLLPRLHCSKVKWWRQTIRRPPRRSEGDDGQLGDRWQPVIQACLLRFFKCQRQNDCRRMLYRIKVRFHFHWLERPQQPHRFAALDRSAPDCQFGASLAFLISISSTIPSLLPSPSYFSGRTLIRSTASRSSASHSGSKPFPLTMMIRS